MHRFPQDLDGMGRQRRLVLQDQEGMDRKRRSVSEMSSFQATREMQLFPRSFTNPNPYILENATGEMQRFPGSFTNPNPYILEDVQQSRVPRTKRYWENQNRKRKSPHQSQFSGARDGASVHDTKINATRNLQVCNNGATPEQHPGFVSKTISHPVERDCRLFGVNLLDSSRREQEKTSCDSSQETQYRDRYSTRSRTKVYKQGNAIGRSVDLTKFEGYPELFGELEVLFNLKGQLRDSSKDWLVVYKDYEGDIILIGDEPWQQFCSLVRKIFIYTSERIEKNDYQRCPNMKLPSSDQNF